MDKQDVFRVLAMAGLVALEWYAMQPFHEPVIAKAWLMWARFCQYIASLFGRLGLHAEHSYYIAVEMGL